MKTTRSVIKDLLEPSYRPGMFKHMAGSALTAKCCRKGFKDPDGRNHWKGMCCCTCRFRYDDHSHPMTDGEPCTHLRGYICGAPELGFSSGWGEHGLCECWEKKKGK